MTVHVVDASALLAFLEREPGSDIVERVLTAGETVVGAANWSEIAQKLLAHGRNWDFARGLVISYGITIEPVTAEDAELAAQLWERGTALSLADRLCLALGARLDAPVITADQAWQGRERVTLIR